MPTPKLTNEIIDAAISGLEEQKRKIDGQIADLRAMRTGSLASAGSTNARGRGRRKMSAAGRRAIAEAQRKRWAALKGEAPRPAKKAKRRLSPEGRAAISAAAKKRWATQKAAKK